MVSADRPVPKPGPPPAPQRWFQERTSPYPWEQDGLDHIRRLMPNVEPHRAWATFSFTAASGRINECDLLVAVPGGLYLVELKGHPGRVVNNGETWSFYHEDTRRPRTLSNPLHLTDLKSKELKARLAWAAKQLGLRDRVPRVEPIVFLSAPGLESTLDEVQRTRVYGRDDNSTGLPWIWRDLLGRPPQRESQRIKPEFSRRLPDLLKKIGIRASTAHLRFGDDWTLTPDPLDAGPTWEDRLAERTGIVQEEGRVRIYLTAQQATEEARQSVERAARREYQVLQGITHRGIAQAMEIREHQGGPAIRFRHRATDLRLDAYLALYDATLTPEVRLDLVRQLGEAVRYAHSRSLYHRALAARSVYVSAKDDGSSPVLRIIDWQSAARDFDTTGMSSILTSTGGRHIGDIASGFLAPEFDTPYADPVDLDVFGLGALAYLIVTGQQPATTRGALVERLRSEGGLHPYAVTDSVSDALDELVFRATRADVADRLDSADAFLDGLNLVEQDSPTPEPTGGGVDPLEALPGQPLDGDWVVERVLGTGATAKALLVIRSTEADDDRSRPDKRVVKIALDEEKAERLRAEARALELVGGGVVVRLLDGPRTLGGRTVLDLEFAGDRSLGALLRAEGRVVYHELERFGNDLFTALDQLAAKGVRHRDLKPDNFGVFERADGTRQLVLFDFSLHGVSERDVKAGTRGYLDPFLDTARRPVFDDHAERYAAAVTLHEMASAQRPVWGDGMTDPRTATDETPTIAADLFEPALRDGLVDFFLRAFHSDVDRRFDTLQQTHEAWRSIFAGADAARPVTTPATVDMGTGDAEETRDAHVRAADRDTPLEAAGLTPRAVSVAQTFGASTVGELLDVPLHQIAKARGAGAVIRKELNRRHKQWTAALRRPAERSSSRTPKDSPEEQAGLATPGLLTVDDMADLLTPSADRKRSSKADAVRLTLGLPDASGVPQSWPTQGEVARRLGITQASVSRHQSAAAKEWAAATWLDAVRDELVDAVVAAGRVMTAHELAAALRARHGATGENPELAAAKASAVVRAAVEAEVWAGMNSGDEDAGPRLAVLRRGARVLVACESLVGTDDPSAPELADYAQALGKQADDLASRDPLPGRGVVLRELRAVTPPDGLAPLADTRLVALAAAASGHAAGSPRLELYPRELDLAKAFRIAQAGAGVRRDIGVTVDDVVSRVRARFPELVLPKPLTHVPIGEALRAAGFPLEYDTTAKRFQPPAPEYARVPSSTGTSVSAHARLVATGHDPAVLIRTKLTAAIERGGFVALTLRGGQLPGTAEAIIRDHPVRPVDLDREFLDELRALVAERGQDWEKVLSVDARFAESGEMSPGLASYVRATWTRVADHLLDPANSADAVLFVHNAGLLARYFDEGGHDLLTRLQNAARRPADAPRGLWLLCPGESALDTAQLDGRTVEVLGDSERVALTSTFLVGLRGDVA
ncbi:BREX system serine/threonine kinase PglW [Saccharothrix violaceirubra]|uniref:Serine/threonine protein kinase n=1 Tax=Saccharothrix violaceirubra TaxID=413306 RepID=A0A7W7T6F1_9PSEU|nr:BREX system serine/threonine kinase PglW [Saccharothrix violaceirubra]MBB4967433.1 serine/threonine protein kinase [Saccharothrix violaceirubra]